MNNYLREIAANCWEKRTYGPQFDQEKFAQLIIQECIDVAFHKGDNIDYLKKHFGIEE
jgi:hypothetical protein